MIDFSVDISSMVLPDGHAVSGSIDTEDDVRRALGQVSEGFGFRGFMIRDLIYSRSHWTTAKEVALAVTAGRIWLPEVGSATHYHATYVNPA